MYNKKTILKVNNLNFSTSNKKILKNISLELEKGDFVSIIGPNGSGKTTFLKNCLSLYSIPSNTIFIKGKDLTKYTNSELSKIIAYIPQDTNITYDLSVEEIVLMGRIPYLNFFENYSANDYDIAKKSMIDMNIYHLKDLSITNLSGGEKQKVFIAKALCQQAELIILDEPISELDISNLISTMKLLSNLNKTNNITILCVLHDISVALNFSKKLMVINNGQLVKFSGIDEILSSNILHSTFDINIELLKHNNKYYVAF